MKRILLLIFLYLSIIPSYSQVDPESSKSKKIKKSRYVFISTVKFSDTAPAGSDKNFIYTILESTTVLIDSSDENYIYFRKSPQNNNEVFAAKKKDYYFNTKKQFNRYKGAEVGLYTIPFRLRGSGDDFDFETNLSLSANIVFGFGSRDSQTSWFDASAGIGLSSISLNPKNSNVTENRTASALTLSIGGVIKPTSRANIGLFLGGDFLGRNDRNVDWKYNKNLWIGIGINISFNKIETDEPATTTSSTDENNLENNIINYYTTAQAKNNNAKSDIVNANAVIINATNQKNNVDANPSEIALADAQIRQATITIVEAQSKEAKAKVEEEFAKSEASRIKKDKKKNKTKIKDLL